MKKSYIFLLFLLLIPSGSLAYYEHKSLVVQKKLLYDYELKKREKHNQNIENSKSEIGWGHQIRSYVLQPYRLVTVS